MSGSALVWDLVTDSGARYLVDLATGMALPLRAWSSAECANGWVPLECLPAVEVGRPVDLQAASGPPLVTGVAVSWDALVDRVLLAGGDVVVSNGVLRRVHGETACAGRPTCWIHRPSDHHMRTWPVYWRDDLMSAERLCEHGVGHPDPDATAYRQHLGEQQPGMHGCDGCCAADQHREL